MQTSILSNIDGSSKYERVNSIPPILSATAAVPSSISVVATTWQRMVCRVLPDFACAAATRSHRCQQDPLALLPVARSPSRSHYCGRWWALTPPFHPSPTGLPAAGLLSVAVVVRHPLPDAALTYCFVRQRSAHRATPSRSREVPLPKSILRQRRPEFTLFSLVNVQVNTPVATTNLPVARKSQIYWRSMRASAISGASGEEDHRQRR